MTVRLRTDGHPSGYNSLQLYNLVTRRPRSAEFASAADVGSVTALEFSRDGTMLTLAGEAAEWWRLDGTVPRLAGPLVYTSSDLYEAISPDGRTVVAAGPSYLETWRLDARHPVFVHIGRASVSALAFHPNGKTVAVATESVVRLWDVASGQPVGAAMPTDAGQDLMGFSPDGTTLAIIGDSGGVQLWDVATTQRIGAPLSNPAAPEPLDAWTPTFSPDGTWLSITSKMGDPSQLRNVGYLLPSRTPGYLCQQAGQTLTPSQWAQYAPQISYQDVCRPQA
jgi:WD40 repeat protein